MPVVGMVIGMALAVTFDLMAATFQLPPVIAAAISVGTGWAITGCFHEDGLSDSADGKFSAIYLDLHVLGMSVNHNKDTSLLPMMLP